MANRAIYGPPRPRPPATPGLLQRFQGAMQQPGGLLGSNPLLGMGIGLLSQGPSLTPINPLQGLGAGFGLYNQARQQGLQQQLAERRLGLQERELEADEAAARREAEQQAALQQAQIVALTPEFGAERAAQIVAAGAADRFLKPEQAEGLKQVMRDGQRVWVPESEAVGQQAPTPGPLVQVGATGAVTDRPLTDREADILNIPPEARPGLVVRDGNVIKRPMTEAETESAAAEKAAGNVSSLLDELESMISPLGLYGADQKRAEQIRNELAFAIARRREPTGKLTDADIEAAKKDIPEVGGPYDAYTAPEAIRGLRMLFADARTKPRQEGDGPKRTPLPPSETLSDEELLNYWLNQ